jgi:hypothetical protein
MKESTKQRIAEIAIAVIGSVITAFVLEFVYRMGQRSVQ